MGIRQSGLRFLSGRSVDISSEEVQFIIKGIKKLKIIKYQQLYVGYCGENCCGLANELEEKLNASDYGSERKTKVENNSAKLLKASHNGKLITFGPCFMFLMCTRTVRSPCSKKSLGGDQTVLKKK